MRIMSRDMNNVTYRPICIKAFQKSNLIDFSFAYGARDLYIVKCGSGKYKPEYRSKYDVE